MNRMNLLPNEALQAQRKHRLAYASLLFAMLLPMVVGITGLGLLLKRLFPSPDALHIAAGACAFIVTGPVLMFIGAGGWLLIARRKVPRSAAQAFFVHRGFGILSQASEWMFTAVYGEQVGPKPARPSDESKEASPRRPS
jgi:hypothetical protein